MAIEISEIAITMKVTGGSPSVPHGKAAAVDAIARHIGQAEREAIVRECVQRVLFEIDRERSGR